MAAAIPCLSAAATAMAVAIALCSAAVAETPKSWNELDRDLAALAPTASLLAAEVTDGSCRPVHARDAGRVTAIGSSFKLYVLAELAAQVADGRLDWEQPVAIENRYRSIPHGGLLYAPDGRRYSLRYLAEQMIQRSDNTATDHLLFLLGREAVEKRMEAAGHRDPALNRPLLATREFAVMKFLWSDAQLARYLDADEETRRTVLAEEARGWPALESYFEREGEQTRPQRIDTVEWFADRFDMCRLLVALKALGGETGPRPVLEVTMLDDRLGLDAERWPTVGFKGGSEMGVLAGNWLLERNDGRWFVLAMALNDPQSALDLGAAVKVLQAAADRLYATP